MDLQGQIQDFEEGESVEMVQQLLRLLRLNIHVHMGTILSRKVGGRFANFKPRGAKISVSRHFLPNVSLIMQHLNWAYQKNLR